MSGLQRSHVPCDDLINEVVLLRRNSVKRDGGRNCRTDTKTRRPLTPAGCGGSIPGSLWQCLAYTVDNDPPQSVWCSVIDISAAQAFSHALKIGVRRLTNRAL